MKKNTIYVLIGLSLLMTACGKKEEEAAPAVAPAPVAPSAPIAAPAPAVDCFPITGVIPFQLGNAFVNLTQLDKRLYRVVAGKFPQDPQVYGQVTLGGQPAGGPYGRESAEGKISFALNLDQSLTPIPNGLLNTQSNGVGAVQLSQVAINNALSKISQGLIQIPGLSGTGSISNFNGVAPTAPPTAEQVCVSGVAINGGTLQTGNINQFYGDVYLYLNRPNSGVTSNSGYVLKF